MGITVIVDLESIIGWVLLGVTLVVGIILWILCSIADAISDRKRKKMHEEYDRKFSEWCNNCKYYKNGKCDVGHTCIDGSEYVSEIDCRMPIEMTEVKK